MDQRLMDKKIADAKRVVNEALDRFPVAGLRIAWTGGKDSTVVAWLVREVCLERQQPIPRAFCIDEGDMFDEVRAFLDEWKVKWNIDLDMIHNDDVSRHARDGLGGEVRVADLNDRNRREIERLGYDEETFLYEPESFVGNHLMKTVACMMYLEQQGVQAFLEGVRWDEQGARAQETFFSPRPTTAFNPEHFRVNPILHFTERDVWDVTLHSDLPILSLYRQGYRSLGARVTTRKISAVPAWEQDLENTTERGGRRQDKEGLMQKLRDLGYM